MANFIRFRKHLLSMMLCNADSVLPGMIMNAAGLLIKNPSPSIKEIKEGMENNLCRCGAHVRIVDAVETASKEMKGGK